MKRIDRDSALTIAAALLVLLSAMFNPVLTIALVVVILIVTAVTRLLGRA